jgi:threonine dehydratase
VDVEVAAARIAPYLRVTPVVTAEGRAFGTSSEVHLKLDSLQHSGSFKARGAFNRILANAVPGAGVLAASGGNHGAAVAYAARALGHRAEIFVPEVASPVKVARLRDYGARVTVTGRHYAEAYEASLERARDSDALYVHAYDQPEVVAGQGTAAREFEMQVPDLDTVLVAVGGGGLIGGTAAWFQGRVKVVGVEPERCPSLAAALREGRPTDVEVGGIAADALGARRVGALPFALARAHAAEVLLVADEEIRAAQRRLWHELRVVGEPGGVTALAALTSGAYRPARHERVGVLVCGANGDLTPLLPGGPEPA